MFCRCGSVEPAGSKVCSKCGETLFGVRRRRTLSALQSKNIMTWAIVFSLGVAVGLIGLIIWQRNREPVPFSDAMPFDPKFQPPERFDAGQ